MDKQTQIFLFYLAIIVIPAIIVYRFAQPDNKMVYSLSTSLGGVVLSMILWFSYGKQMVALAKPTA